VRDDREPPTLQGVGERSSHDREHEHGDQLDEAEQPDGQRRTCELVHLERHDDGHDLVTEVRYGPPDEQAAEISGGPERVTSTR
jgi:hypothetical protein